MPYQEISAGLGADLRSMARECELLIFHHSELGKRRRKWSRKGNSFISPSLAGRVLPKGQQWKEAALAAGYPWLSGEGQVVIFNHIFSVILY